MQLYNRYKTITLEAGAIALVLGLSCVVPMSRSFAAAAHHSGLHSITIPADTALVIRMIEPVDSVRNRAGDHFTASLEADLVADGKVITPRGATVYGKLSEVQGAGHVAGKSELRLELTDILVNDRLLPIVTGAYHVVRSSRGADTAKKIAAGGGTGAVPPVFAEGPKVHIPRETVLEFRLRQPLVINHEAD